jgi:hypothetical protein
MKMKHLKNRVAILLAVILILTASAVGLAEAANSTAIDKAAFDTLVASGPVADDDTVILGPIEVDDLEKDLDDFLKDLLKD